MRSWVITQSVDVSKQITEHPFMAAIGAWFMWIFGALYGNSQIAAIGMGMFVLLIVLDWLSGTTAAKKDKIDTSAYSLEGWKRTAFLLILPIVAHIGDLLMNTGVMIMGFVLFSLSRGVARSVLANTKRAGWGEWFPEGWLNWIETELNHKDARAKKRLEELQNGDIKPNIGGDA